MIGFRIRVVCFVFFLLLFSPAWADEGSTPSDWERRLQALEERVQSLEEENTALKQELGHFQSDRKTSLAPPQAAEKPLPEPNAVQVGHGTLKVNALFQGWYVSDQDGNDRLRLRRSEIKFTGKVSESTPVDYTVMLDPAQVTEDATRKNVLQDAFVTLGVIPRHTLDIGQYKPGITEEGSRSPAKVDTIERAYISRTFGDQRDIGVRLSGKWPYADYNVGVFNGSGINQADANDQKDIAGRIVLRPLKESGMDLLKDFEIGASGYHRPAHGSTFAKKRLGYEARYAYKNFSLKGEYMTGQGTATASSTSENRTLSNGWYGQAAYYFLPKLQGVLKIEGYDPNEEASEDRVTETTVGLNYFIDQYYAKLQLNYIHKDEEAEDDIANDQLIGAMQVVF